MAMGKMHFLWPRLFKELCIFYKTYGSGKQVVVFLHGWGCDHKTLMPFINLFKKNFKCVCVDFCGFGCSGEPQSPLTLEDYKNSVVQILNKLDIKTFSIVAHSFGARVGILLAQEKNLSIQKMFFVGPAGVKPKFSIKKFLKIKLFKILKFLSKIGFYSKANLNKWGSDDYKSLSPVMKKTFINIVSQDLKPSLKNISVPVYVVIGENDKETPPYMGRIMSKKIKDCQFKIIKGAGHFCFLEKTEPVYLAYYFIKC